MVTRNEVEALLGNFRWRDGFWNAVIEIPLHGKVGLVVHPGDVNADPMDFVSRLLSRLSAEPSFYTRSAARDVATIYGDDEDPLNENELAGELLLRVIEVSYGTVEPSGALGWYAELAYECKDVLLERRAIVYVDEALAVLHVGIE
jgi:hypothetical protein